MKRIFLLFLAMSVLSACSSPGIKSSPDAAFNPRHHAIYITETGDIKQWDEAKEQLASVDRKRAESEYVDGMLGQLAEVRKSKPDLKVVVFIHGGLNSSKDVWERVNDFTPQMLRENRYPIFVGWNSGGVPNYFDHLLRLRQGERYAVAAGWASSPFVLLSDVGRSVARIPAGISQAASDLLLIPISIYGKPERDYQDRMDRVGGHYNGVTREWESDKFNVTSRAPFEGGGPYISVVNPAKFLVAPFLDGFGSGAWDSMLRRTDLVLSKPIAFEGKVPPGTLENYGDTAVTTLLKRLETQQNLERKAGERPVGIDLIGHSMGTFVVNNILTRHPSLEIDHVVFMGAAAPVKDIENVVVPWLRKQPDPERIAFYNLSIDQYRELGENFFWDFVPRGSLLRWIDTIFGEVNSFKDRTAGTWWNIIRAAEDVFPPDVRHQVHLTRFSIGGPKYGPQKHGEFDNYYFWRKEFWCAERDLAIFNPNLAPGRHPQERVLRDGACTTAKLKTASPVTSKAGH